MMIGEISYGAVTLKLATCLTSREPIFSDDGMDYLCTRVQFEVLSTWSPTSTSYAALISDVPQTGEAFAGRTDKILMNYMATPRRKLLVQAYDANGVSFTYLESPSSESPIRGGAVALPCDVRGGPFCRKIAITGKHGPKTWEVVATFETFINECLDKRSPIISHRWTKTVDVNEDSFQTITTRGIVVFHPGRQYQANQSPDFYRSQFFQPPSGNFARERINVEVSSDNSRAEYTVTDVERPMNLGTGSPATRIEANLTTWYSQGSVMEAVADIAPTVNQNSWGVISRPWTAFGALSNNLNAFSGAMQSQLPQYYANLKCRAWGARDSSRADLMRLCMGIAGARLGPPSFFGLARRTEIVVSQSLHTPFVEVDMTLRWSQSILPKLAGYFGPIGSVGATLGLMFGNDNGLGFLANYFPINENMENLQGVPNNTYLTKNPVGNRPVNATPAAPLSAQDKNSRGPGYTKYVLTQALMGQCQVPPMPGYGNLLTDQAVTEVNPSPQLVPTLTVPPLPPAPPVP